MYLDLALTWPQWANVYGRMAEGAEVKAVREMRDDLAKMAKAAEALHILTPSLTRDQLDKLAEAMK